MNGARTTFMRRGYLLTALAAAVLLAASPGTASAQTVGFVGDTTIMAMEGAGEAGTGIAPVQVTVSRTVTRTNPNAFEAAGELTVQHNGAAYNGLVISGPAGALGASPANLNFTPGVNEITLTIVIPQDQADWDDEELVLTLRTTEPGVVPDPAQVTIMIDDNEPMPEFRFDRTTIDLTETSTTTVDVTVGVGPAGSPGEGDLEAALNALAAGGAIMLSVDPANAVATNGPISIMFGPAGGALAALPAPDARGRYNIGDINTAVAGTSPAESIVLSIEANSDRAGFQDPVINLTLTDGRTPTAQATQGGAISGGMAMLNVLSNEPKPTVSFSPTDVSVMEGGSVTSTLLASGQFGAEVEMVKLSVEGAAMVGLYQDGEMLEEMDGYVMVDLGASNSARLTAMSMSDPELMDGEMKSKTWKIMEADGANVDQDAYWLTVTVEGSTAVPALPLVGQLLLALFLMAGGSRLYRRRRG